MALGSPTTAVYVKPPTEPVWESYGGMIDMAQTVHDLAPAYGGMVAATGNIYGNIYLSGITTGIPGPRTASAVLPDRFVLAGCFPNPFNPTTTIRYGLPRASMVELTVFNVLGERVATLLHEVQDAGWHDVTFHASAFASGVYLYRLQAGEFVQTKKLVLVR
jgi:hypothetical protein